MYDYLRPRIPYEERVLYKFYKDEYRLYRLSTRVGIPFISSPLLAKESR
jgi:protein-S-isoprenylcysteine O-methyltransferase Ste14